MKFSHRLILTAALTLTASMSAGLAMMPAPQQPQPPADKPAQPPMPEMPPAPGEHHKWLDKFVGTWAVESEMTPPGADPIKMTGTDTVRSLGGRWIIGEFKCQLPAEMGGDTMNAIMTVGYNSDTGKYQGTWVDNMTDHMWIYTGTVDPTGKILTLEAEGPNMMDPAGGTTKFRDVVEFKSDDHRTLTSSALVDGKWVTFGKGDYRRVK